MLINHQTEKPSAKLSQKKHPNKEIHEGNIE